MKVAQTERGNSRGERIKMDPVSTSEYMCEQAQEPTKSRCTARIRAKSALFKRGAINGARFDEMRN